MLTISISEALQGPAAWGAWGSPEDLAAAEAWQREVSATEWGLDGQSGEAQAAITENLSLGSLPEAWNDANEDQSHWNPWSADASLPIWPQEDFASMQAADATLALATAMASSALQGSTSFADEGVAKSAAPNQAALASPLRVPLPEPLTVARLSENLELGMELEILELPEATEEPQKVVSGPPGLGGCGSPRALALDIPGPIPATAAVVTAAVQAPPGITIRPSEVGGRSCTHVDWKIDDFSGKLQASMGRPVVSPAFDANGLSNLRLMVFPDARDAVKSARSHERKGLYATMVKKGPLYGSLKLKADGLERATVMTFTLLVGSVRAGPTTYDFSEQAVLGLDDFGVDWLQQVDKRSGSLNVGIEIIEVRQK